VSLFLKQMFLLFENNQIKQVFIKNIIYFSAMLFVYFYPAVPNFIRNKHGKPTVRVKTCVFNTTAVVTKNKKKQQKTQHKNMFLHH